MRHAALQPSPYPPRAQRHRAGAVPLGRGTPTATRAPAHAAHADACTSAQAQLRCSRCRTETHAARLGATQTCLPLLQGRQAVGQARQQMVVPTAVGVAGRGGRGSSPASSVQRTTPCQRAPASAALRPWRGTRPARKCDREGDDAIPSSGRAGLCAFLSTKPRRRHTVPPRLWDE